MVNPLDGMLDVCDANICSSWMSATPAYAAVLGCEGGGVLKHAYSSYASEVSEVYRKHLCSS